MTNAKPLPPRRRTVTPLATAEDRAKLAPQKKPYWMVVAKGVALGLWVGASGQTWVARRQNPYRESTIGVPEGQEAGPGRPVLSFGQAFEAAKQWADSVVSAQTTILSDEVLPPELPLVPPLKLIGPRAFLGDSGEHVAPIPQSAFLGAMRPEKQGASAFGIETTSFPKPVGLVGPDTPFVAGVGMVPADPLVSDALDEHLFVLESDQPESIGSSRSLFRQLKREIGDIRFSKLTSQHLTDWMVRTVNSPPRRRPKKNGEPNFATDWDPLDPVKKRKRQSTANRKFATLKAALYRALRNNWPHAKAFWWGVTPYPDSTSRRQTVLTIEEQAEFLNNCSPELRPLSYAALLTGSRYGPMCRWKVKDFRPAECYIVIGWDKKHHCDKIAPLTEEAILVFHYITLGRDPDEYMFLRANGEPWGKGHQGRPFEEAAKALEKKVSIYTLRHTVITGWLEHDVDKEVVAKTLNTSPKMVDDHYNHVKAHKTSEDISAKVPKLVEWGDEEKAILDRYRNEHAEKMAKKMKLNFPLSSLHPSAYYGKIDGGRVEAPPPKPRPTTEELAALVKEMPVSAIAELYETSHPTVKKWCKQAGIEVLGRGEWQKRKAQERIAIKRAEGGLFSGGDLPSREELEPLIWSMPATEVAKRYAVKGPTILKWAAKLGIPCPGPGYWSKVDGQRKQEEKQKRRQAWKEQQSKKS